METNFLFQLLYLGRDYPAGYEYFRNKLKQAFIKNKDVTNPEQIEKLIGHGRFISKEIEALYMLKKYRTLKKRYYSEEEIKPFKNLETLVWELRTKSLPCFPSVLCKIVMWIDCIVLFVLSYIQNKLDGDIGYFLSVKHRNNIFIRQ